MALTDRMTSTIGLVTTMARAGVIAPMRPDKYVRVAAAMARENMGITSGFAAAAQRCPDRPGLVDEIGTLTWRESTGAQTLWRPDCRNSPAGHPARSASWPATTVASSRH